MYRKIKLRADQIEDPYGDIVRDAAKKIATDIDNFYFQILALYGITHHNYQDYLGRLEIIIAGVRSLDDQMQTIILDGERIIDIRIWSELTELAEQNGSISMKYNTHYDVIWEKERKND